MSIRQVSAGVVGILAVGCLPGDQAQPVVVKNLSRVPIYITVNGEFKSSQVSPSEEKVALQFFDGTPAVSFAVYNATTKRLLQRNFLTDADRKRQTDSSGTLTITFSSKE